MSQLSERIEAAVFKLFQAGITPHHLALNHDDYMGLYVHGEITMSEMEPTYQGIKIKKTDKSDDLSFAKGYKGKGLGVEWVKEVV